MDTTLGPSDQQDPLSLLLTHQPPSTRRARPLASPDLPLSTDPHLPHHSKFVPLDQSDMFNTSTDNLLAHTGALMAATAARRGGGAGANMGSEEADVPRARSKLEQSLASKSDLIFMMDKEDVLDSLPEVLEEPELEGGANEADFQLGGSMDVDRMQARNRALLDKIQELGAVLEETAS